MTSKQYAKANKPRAANYDQPSQTNISREKPPQLGDEPSTAQRRFQVEASDAHRRADNEDEIKIAYRVDLGGGPWSTRESSTKPRTATHSRQRRSPLGRKRCQDTKKE